MGGKCEIAGNARCAVNTTKRVREREREGILNFSFIVEDGVLLYMRDLNDSYFKQRVEALSRPSLLLYSSVICLYITILITQEHI